MSSVRLGDKIHEIVCTVNILCRELTSAATKVQLDKTRWADCSLCCSMLTTNGTVRYLDRSERCNLYCCIKCKEIIINVRHEGLIFFNLNAGILLSFNKITSFEPIWVKASLSHTANSFSFPSYVPVPVQSSAALRSLLLYAYNLIPFRSVYPAVRHPLYVVSPFCLLTFIESRK